MCYICWLGHLRMPMSMHGRLDNSMVLLLYNIPGKLSSMWTCMQTRPCDFVLLRPFVWHALCGLAGLSDMPPLAVSLSHKSYTRPKTKFPTCPVYQNIIRNFLTFPTHI